METVENWIVGMFWLQLILMGVTMGAAGETIGRWLGVWLMLVALVPGFFVFLAVCHGELSHE
jgi:hypothetical protein